jgi:hypothetical protein
MWQHALVLLLALCLQGCANFMAVSAFANRTTGMTATVREEFGKMEALCFTQAELSIVLAGGESDRPRHDCEEYHATQGRLADVTLNVLEGYASALGGLADNQAFDLSPDIQNIGGKIQGLQDRSGNALVNAKEVGALTKVADLLADIVVSAKRESAVRRMVEEAPNLRSIGDILKSFFVESPGVPPGRAKAPYTNLVAIGANSINSAEVNLSNKAAHAGEPMRRVELLRALQERKALLATRAGTSPDRVPMKIAAAIDEWQQAVDVFASDALKPDPRALYERLAQLRTKVIEARDAVRGKSD